MMFVSEIEMKMIELLISRANDNQIAAVSAMIAWRKAEIPSNEEMQPWLTKLPLKVGDRVIFTGRKTKPPVIGTIKSFNDKTVTIINCSDGGAGWRMPKAALTLYTEPK